MSVRGDDNRLPLPLQLKRGGQVVELDPAQVNTESLRRIFGVSPDGVWLREEFSGRAHFPDDEGNFSVSAVGICSHLIVEGPAFATHAQSPTITVPCTPGPSSTMPQRTAGSQVPPFFRSVVRAKSSTINLKVVLAKMTTTESGKCSFNAESQMFIELTESTANVNHIVSAVRYQWGQDVILVSSDGLEFENSQGSQGLKFWKAPRRKVYAIRMGDREQKLKWKKSSPVILDDSDEELAPKKRSKFTSDLEEMKEDIACIAAVVRDIKELDKTSTVPLAMKKLVTDAFKCKLCLQAPMRIPPIFTRCCRTLLGCEHCVNGWYSGTDALTKTCPVCRAERGYSETMVLRGLDDFLTGIDKIMNPEDNTGSSDQE